MTTITIQKATGFKKTHFKDVKELITSLVQQYELNSTEELKQYNPNDDTFWPFDSAEAAIKFLNRNEW